MSPRLMGFIGFFLLGTFFFEYRLLDIQTSNWNIILPTLIRGVAIAMLIAPLTATAMNAVPKNQAGMASSMLNIIQQVGGSIGIAILSLILHRRSVYHLNHVASNISTSSSSFTEVSSNIFQRAHEIGHTYAESAKIAGNVVSQQIVKATGVLAFQDAFLVGAIITYISLFLVFLLPNRPVIHKSSEPLHLE